MLIPWLLAASLEAGVAAGGAKEEAGAPANPLMEELIALSRSKDALYVTGLGMRPVTRADVPPFLDYVKKHPDYRSYHLLFALRQDQPKAYQSIPATVRASVLCSALGQLRCLLDWQEPCMEVGPPGDLRDANEAERALLEIGKPAVRYLLQLLDDRSAADFGWQEGDPPQYEDYRRADVALRYLPWILGLPYRFRPEPAERDRAIRALKERLRGGKQAEPGR